MRRSQIERARAGIPGIHISRILKLTSRDRMSLENYMRLIGSYAGSSHVDGCAQHAPAQGPQMPDVVLFAHHSDDAGLIEATEDRAS